MIQATRPFISVEIAKGAKWSEMIGGSRRGRRAKTGCRSGVSAGSSGFSAAVQQSENYGWMKIGVEAAGETAVAG